MNRIVPTVVALVLVSTASAGQSIYRTDNQAQTYLEHGFTRWAGINLSTQAVKFASCLNGYYSKTEHRTHKHFPQGKTNRYGEAVFRSFSCDFTTAGRTFNLYLVRTQTEWKVATDR